MNARIYKKSSAGLTLLELIIVLALIAILSAGVSFAPLERRLVYSAAEEILSDVRYMQRIALIEGVRTEIVLNERDNSYTLEKWEDGGFVTIKKVRLDPAIKTLYTNASGKNINFTPRGTTGSACTITVSSAGYTAALTINIGSGRVKITEFIKTTGR